MTSPAAPAEGWSSTLSVAEHAALHEAGFVPRGLVMGSSVYRIGTSWSPMDMAQAAPWGGPGLGGPGMGGPWGGGWAGGGGQWGGRTGGGIVGGGVGGPWGGGGRWAGSWGSFPGWTRTYSADDLGWGGGLMTGAGSFGGWALAICWERYVFEDAIEAAAGQAIERLRSEARALDAHGVVATRLTFRYLEGLPSTVEFTAIGTAVARRGAAPLARPFTSHLRGQDLLKLLRAGLVPYAVAVGAGSVVAEVPGRWSGGAVEIPPYGDAVEATRRIAGERLVRNTGGGGWAVVGTLASTGTEGSERGRVSTAILTGTLVRRFAAEPPTSLPLPVLRLSRP